MRNTFFKLVTVMFSVAIFGSCNDTTGGSSTPIDSTNQSGKASVQYTEGTPATIDTTIQARDAHSKDTLGNRAGAASPNGNGTNSSNTSDAKTTSGSSNNGDADKDRKK